MPRVVTLSTVTLGSHMDLGCDFTLALVDGELSVVDTNLRRIIEPNQDIDEQCDGLDVYLEQNKYPKISAEDRQLIKDTRSSAEQNPAMVARRDKWLEEQEAQQEAMNESMPTPEPSE